VKKAKDWNHSFNIPRLFDKENLFETTARDLAKSKSDLLEVQEVR
jgi:hypothetical protein